MRSGPTLEYGASCGRPWPPDDSSHWNDNPRPFTWHKTPEEILDRLAGYCRSLNKKRALQLDGTPGQVVGCTAGAVGGREVRVPRPLPVMSISEVHAGRRDVVEDLAVPRDWVGQVDDVEDLGLELLVIVELDGPVHAVWPGGPLDASAALDPP